MLVGDKPQQLRIVRRRISQIAHLRAGEVLGQLGGDRFPITDESASRGCETGANGLDDDKDANRAAGQTRCGDGRHGPAFQRIGQIVSARVALHQ